MRLKALGLVLLVGLLVTTFKFSASAACVDSSNYGQVELVVPELPTKGKFTIWTRLQIPSVEDSSYQLVINDDTCFEVGGAKLATNNWQWVNFYDNDTKNIVSYDFRATGNNSLRLIGTKAGVKIDRLLFINDDCTPAEDGSNCIGAATIDNSAGATVLPPISLSPLKGKVILSPTLINESANIERVEYYEGGQHLQTVEGAGAFDTTLLANGQHKILLKISKTSSQVVNEITEVTIENPQSVLSPFYRWARLNQKTFIVLLIVVSTIIFSITVWLVIRWVQLRKRYTQFHGLD
jgi:hypothetical protein